MELPFLTFKYINTQASKRKIVLFGSSDIAYKTTQKLSKKIDFIVDNNPNIWGSSYLDVRIDSPQELLKFSKSDYFIIITTTSFVAVSQQLSDMGFVPESDFVVSPILNDLRIIGELETKRAKILFSSGAPPTEATISGGGIYELELDGSNYMHRKVYSGNCHGIFLHDDRMLIVDDHQGLVELDHNYKIVRKGKIPEASRPHGIAYSELTGKYYVVSSHLDQILVFNQELEYLHAFSISDKMSEESLACHHCNDICIVGNSIFVSMFSYTGNWRRDVYDGVVLEINLNTGRIIGPVIRDLWMPHSVAFIEGSLVVLDSLRGEFKKNNAQVVGRFPGFARGLGFDQKHYYIGQSRNRNFSKFLGLSLNTSIDTGIILFDEETKVSRTLLLPNAIAEIHSVVFKG